MKLVFRLARIAATLFPDVASSALVMAQTGMATERILLEQPAVTRWYAITVECEKAGLLPTLLELLLSHYPSHDGLLALKVDSTIPQLLIALGSDSLLHSDIDALREVRRTTGLEFIRLMNVSLSSLHLILARAWANGQPMNVHLAVHSGEQGFLFAEGWVSAAALSEVLTGVNLLVLASCDGGSLLDDLRSIPYIIALDTKLTHEDASLFTRLFWTAIGQHATPQKALAKTLPKLPNTVREYVSKTWR